MICRRTIEAGGCVILVPGLLAGVRHRDNLPATERLCLLLDSAEQVRLSDSELTSLESLTATSLLPAEVSGQTCAAVCTYLSDFPDANVDDGSAAVLRADPVYQQIDMNNATLGHPVELALKPSECADLQQTLNRHFASDGIRFESSDSLRWYCHFEKQPDVSTVPVSAAIGRDVAGCKPVGKDARAWRSKLAEIEMLLFDHPVNVARLENSQLPVNTLWLWGEGVPDVIRSETEVAICSDNFYTQSLATYMGMSCHALPAEALVFSGDKAACLLAIEKFSTPSVGQAAGDEYLQWFEQAVCQTVWKNLSPGSWPQVTLWCGDNRLFHVSASAKSGRWRRFWRRPPPLESFADPDDALAQVQMHGNR